MAVSILGPDFSTCVRSVALVCEEKGIPYEVTREINGRRAARHSSERYELHPFGKVPVLLHQDKTLVETATIIRYLDDEFGVRSLQGKDSWERALCDQWCSLISVYIDRYLVREYMLELAFPTGDDGRPALEKVEAGRPNARAALVAVAKQLGEKPYLISESFSLADAMMAPMLDYNASAPAQFNLVAEHPQLMAYIERIRQRDSGKHVLKPMQRVDATGKTAAVD
jgi:glutathione S-transferase